MERRRRSGTRLGGPSPGPTAESFGEAATETRRGIDGRLIVVGALVVYASALAISQAAWSVDIWPYLGVGRAPTLFFDARNVAAAADCWALGYDPLIENPCDPTGRVMNYPRVWVLLHYVGLTQDRTVLFGWIVVALFVLSLLLLLGRLSIKQGVVVAFAVTSPAVMFAIERGNMDLLLFAVFVAAVFAWKARERLSPLLSPALIVAAAIAKLYAAFALPAYAFTGERRVRWALPAAIAVLGVYVALTIDDFRAVLSAREGGRTGSYGARILIGYLYHLVSPGEWLHGNLLAQAIAILLLGVFAVAAWIWARRRLPWPAGVAQGSPELLAFHLGALTYLGTFALRRNGDYRLVFLLLTLPLLFQLASGPGTSIVTWLGRAGIIAVIARLWLGGLSEFITPAHELASWAIAGIFIALMAATVPRLHLPFAARPRALTGKDTG
jgi:hypothetical protein